MTKSTLGDAYLETIARMEPEIAVIDPGAFYASAAISLKRIADNTPTLRDQFAMSVMPTLMHIYSASAASKMAYDAADMMLFARDQ